MIGIIGGMGPLAGIDLSKKIIEETVARSDQEHISQILYTAPERIGDRTEFILGKISENPAFAIAKIIHELQSLGATVIGLPCNSAHAPQIFDVIIAELKNKKASVKLLHMIDEIGLFVKNEFPTINRLGVLGTSGTYKTRQYNRLENFGFEIINISETEVEEVHQAVYHPDYGIKSLPNEISKKSVQILESACRSLIFSGAEAIVLGCTEIPLALTGKYFENIPLIDSTLVLARALITSMDPGKLKRW